ncbi:DNA-binding protein YbiB [Pseudazoarcus pumilus]|uniref:DNA-binding protein YbiB n=1 Tax=Pseudazoarcus pumilus TaxID=2067960 RepID=A0A2I6S466_9RHOO|nr:DNA-binding protein YbiB [Pseudazoarcus pumilus]AUN94042.1 DNA-binding protein YbiB [Pseudazoarcus pumilus]
MDFPRIIKEIGRGAKGARSMDADTAEALFGAMLDGTVPDLELGAIVIALRVKSESLAELLGFKRAMDARCARVAVPEGPRCVVLPTYNGARRQANLMPLLAHLLAREGVPVLIQGRHDFDSRTSPFELLAALDIEADASVEAAATRLARERIACVQLETLLPGLARLLSLRLRFGVRGSGHTMAKLLDPCPGRSVRVVSVTHPEYLARMHDFLIEDGGVSMLLRGTEGEAFANPRRRPRMQCFVDGRVGEDLPAEEGGAPPLAELPNAPGVADNATLIRDMLDGRVAIPQPLLDQAKRLIALATAP